MLSREARLKQLVFDAVDKDGGLLSACEVVRKRSDFEPILSGFPLRRRVSSFYSNQALTHLVLNPLFSNVTAKYFVRHLTKGESFPEPLSLAKRIGDLWEGALSCQIFGFSPGDYLFPSPTLGERIVNRLQSRSFVFWQKGNQEFSDYLAAPQDAECFCRPGLQEVDQPQQLAKSVQTAISYLPPSLYTVERALYQAGADCRLPSGFSLIKEVNLSPEFISWAQNIRLKAVTHILQTETLEIEAQPTELRRAQQSLMGINHYANNAEWPTLDRLFEVSHAVAYQFDNSFSPKWLPPLYLRLSESFAQNKTAAPME